MDEPALPISATTRTSRKPLSLEREGWWRMYLTNTPIPGTYHLKTFIDEIMLNPVRATYNFKNEGRKKLPLVLRNDPVPNDIPQYMPPDFTELLKKQKASYSFKDKPRQSLSRLAYRDQQVISREINPAPKKRMTSKTAGSSRL